MNIIKYLSIAMLMFSCAPLEEEYPPKWVIASQYLPREQLQGLQQAGFFEINDTIYAHHCDHNGNLIRHKFDEEYKLWKQVRYQTFGCGDPDA